MSGGRRGAARWRPGLLLLTLLACPPAWSAEPPRTPETIPGSTRVDAEELIGLVERLPRLVIIDSRIRGDRKQGYIEGSLSLPDTETDCASLARLLPDPAQPVLFYCNGVKCGRSGHAVTIAITCGYRNVYWFRGGFQEWRAKGYPYLQE